MAERFNYPSDIRQTLARERNRRWIAESLGLAILLLLCLKLPQNSDQWLIYGATAFFVVLVALFEAFLLHFHRWTSEVADHVIEYADGVLTERRSSGEIVGSVNLAGPYKVSSTYHAAGNGIYFIVGPAGQVTISSRLHNADRLMGEILRAERFVEWPPCGNST